MHIMCADASMIENRMPYTPFHIVFDQTIAFLVLRIKTSKPVFHFEIFPTDASFLIMKENMTDDVKNYPPSGGSLFIRIDFPFRV